VWLTVARGAYFAILSMLLLSLAIIVYKKQFRSAVNIVLLMSFSAALAFTSIWASGKFATQLPESTKSQTQYQTSIPQEGISSEGNTERLVEHTIDFTDETSFTDRIKTSKTAGQLFIQNPLTGVGPGNFGRYVVQKYPDNYTDVDQIVNNEPLEILAEVGLLGFLMLMGFVVWCIRSIWRYNIDTNSAESNIWYYSTTLMMLGFVVQWQTFSTLYVTHIWVMIGIMLSILLNSRLRKSN
jgi:O-antigen ligase